MKAETLKRWLRHAPPVLGLLLLFGAVYVVRREYHQLQISDVSAALHAIPGYALVLAACFTVLSYGVLTFYDRLASIYAGHKVGYARTSFASFCAYALSHNLGFAAVSGAAVRYRLYAHWGLTPFQIAKVVAFCSLTFGLGGMVLGGAILFGEPTAVPFFGQHLPRVAMYAAGAGLWVIVAAYLTLAKTVGRVRVFGHVAELPGWRMALLQVVLATVDVAMTAAIFDALLPAAPGLNYLRFLAVYVASYTAGLAANLPGGIGVFDTAMLLGLSPYLEAPTVVGAIVVFRLYYYVIPLFLAGGLFAGNEVMLRSGAILHRNGPSSRWPAPRWLEPDFAAPAATGTVALCGVLLLSMGVLQPLPDFGWIDPEFAGIAISAGQYIPSLLGAALIALTIGLSQRVALAWGATLVFLALAAVFTAAQRAPIWIPGVLGAGMLVVAPLRGAFYRRARLLGGLGSGMVVPLFTLAICLIALAAFEPHMRNFDDNSWWDLVLSPSVPNGLRATVLLAVLLAGTAAARLLWPCRVTSLPWNAETRQLYALMGPQPPVRADGLVLGDAKRAAIPYRRLGRVLLGLGDPAGADSDRVSAIWRLRDLAEQEGLDPAVWYAGSRLLKVYGDLGLTALPLTGDGALAPEDYPDAEYFLCCVAERDLIRLLPLPDDLLPIRKEET